MKSSFALAMVAVYTNAVTINSQASQTWQYCDEMKIEAIAKYGEEMYEQCHGNSQKFDKAGYDDGQAVLPTGFAQTNDDSLYDVASTLMEKADKDKNRQLDMHELVRLLLKIKQNPEILGLKNESESKGNLAQTAAETENYGYAHYGGGSQHYGYAQTETTNIKQDCADMQRAINDETQRLLHYTEFENIHHYEKICKAKPFGLAQTEDAPPSFNEPNWIEKRPAAGGLAQTESNHNCRDAEGIIDQDIIDLETMKTNYKNQLARVERELTMYYDFDSIQDYQKQCKANTVGLAQTLAQTEGYYAQTEAQGYGGYGYGHYGYAQTESNAAAETENHYGYGYGYDNGGRGYGYAQTESNAAAHPAQYGIHMVHAQTESEAAAETEQYHGYDYANNNGYDYGRGYGGYAQTEAPAQ